MLKELRLKFAFGQIEMAGLLGVDQASLARWENGARPIPVSTVLKAAEIAPPELKDMWLEAAGAVSPGPKWQRPAEVRQIPLLKDAQTVGTAKANDEDEWERTFEVPKDWLPKDGVLQAIRTPDDGMSPMIERGFVAIVDVSIRQAEQLKNTLVVCRDGEGVCIRWLRRELGQYVLMPLDPRRNPMKALDTRRHYGLVGEVVLWLGRLVEM
jgi:transcriptional regulator with XRE-family HTH domain